MNGIKISAIVCTHNREGHFGNAVRSLMNQNISESEYEVIIIDNASTDNTWETLEHEFGHVSNVRYLFEPAVGLSRARNRGWLGARGQYVAFLDDDALACANWLKDLCTALDDPEVGAAGGPIFPIYETDVPKWFDVSLLPLYSCRHWGKLITDLIPGRFFYGTNMAIKRNILEQVGGFRTDLGRQGSVLLSDEELAVFKEIETRGYKKRYMPECIVYHVIGRERLTLKWLMRRFYWLGRGEGIRDSDCEENIDSSALKQWLRRTTRNFLHPRYSAGYCTRLIPLVIFIGYLNSIVRWKRTGM
jgi:glycosyltransferase involved in cell wall biosynthesis